MGLRWGQVFCYFDTYLPFLSMSAFCGFALESNAHTLQYICAFSYGRVPFTCIDLSVDPPSPPLLFCLGLR